MTRRFIVLDSFRGLFALIIAIFHFKTTGPIGQITLIRRGDHFVDFFFVLSGFIIYHTYQGLIDNEGQLRFMKNRLLRLYPLHIFMLFVFFAMEIGKYLLYSRGLFKSPVFEKNNEVSFLVNLFFLQSWDITDLSWNYPSWSISAEMFAYFVFCVSIVYINRLRIRARLLAFLALSGLSLLLIWTVKPHFDIRLTSEWGMLRCMYGFFLGCFTYEIYRLVGVGIKEKQLVYYSALEIFVLGTSLLLTTYIHSTQNFLLPIVYSLTILVFAFEQGTLSSWLSKRQFIRLGELSYSIYMVHAAIAIVFELALSVLKISYSVTLTITLFAYLCTVYFVSTLTHRLVEVRVRKWLLNSERVLITKAIYD